MSWLARNGLANNVGLAILGLLLLGGAAVVRAEPPAEPAPPAASPYVITEAEEEPDAAPPAEESDGAAPQGEEEPSGDAPPAEDGDGGSEPAPPQRDDVADTERQQAALAVFGKGKAAYKRRRYQEAMQHLIEARTIFSHPFIDFYMARTHEKLGDRASACRFWARAEGQIEGNEDEIQLSLAQCELMSGKATSALGRLEGLGDRIRKKENYRVKLLEAYALAGLKRVEEAEDRFNAVVGRRMSEELEALTQKVQQLIESRKYGYRLDTPVRREAASLVDNARVRQRERRYEAAVKFALASLERVEHERTLTLRDTLIREWLDELEAVPTASRSEGLLALATVLEGTTLPEELARAVAQRFVDNARERLMEGRRRKAARLAEAALKQAPLPSAREVLIKTASTEVRVFFPSTTVELGTNEGAVGTLVAACEKQAQDPGRCPPVRFQAETDRRPVELTAFYIGRREVTVAQFRSCVEAGACTRDHFDDQSPCPFGQRASDNLPMACVDWFGAQQYCRHVGGRLPTEAEWEAAAAGVAGRTWPWGAEEPHGARANYAEKRAGREGTAYPFDDSSDDGFARTAPVGSFPEGATPPGILDLAGNVAEWVADWFDGRPVSRPGIDAPVIKDPLGPCDGKKTCPGYSKRAIRGGSYASLPIELRTPARDAERPGEVQPWLGFRCVWTR